MAQTDYGTDLASGPVIEAKGLGVKFAVNRRRKRSLREMFIHGTKRDPNAEGDEFWPLRDVSFEVARGDCVGIVGKNGTGKSTLLKMIAGVLIPDEGEVHVRGKVAPLLELRAGFNDNLTGRENVYLVGSLHGMTEKQIDERFEEIIDFAEIKQKFVDTPVRHYSSGMKVRLGFALISQLEHPIMLVDEVLAVGDKAFKRKCYEAIERMLANHRTMVLVSHNEGDLRRFCNRGLYIKGGALALDTDIDAALAAYNEDTKAEIAKRKQAEEAKKKRAEEAEKKAGGDKDGGQAA
ncbi:ATP-binding cassette domain-containing protein [Nocardiopsis changdeensis]|uniref:ATP-binding cassette domain-containing protein n=1 Tax=Nocardiopsis changdeensis TaxID=2831969 RepID=A0ABX8BNB2_9ACTN|nr:MULTISPECIES: ATP-binding cassette domain-containing protein [Nocardiopsis]QUX23734.1 ATP-binding cassette domain-containing protein [Nocardiopsis changdeensis]QYX39679.1 ATP-binding cassette domain-containing protein [Nocardiopsis sp. MT53]